MFSRESSPDITLVFIELVIVFTRADPAFEDLFNTCIWILLDINTVHTNVKKETFEYLLKLTSCNWLAYFSVNLTLKSIIIWPLGQNPADAIKSDPLVLNASPDSFIFSSIDLEGEPGNLP